MCSLSSTTLPWSAHWLIISHIAVKTNFMCKWESDFRQKIPCAVISYNPLTFRQLQVMTVWHAVHAGRLTVSSSLLVCRLAILYYNLDNVHSAASSEEKRNTTLALTVVAAALIHLPNERRPNSATPTAMANCRHVWNFSCLATQWDT